MKTIHVQETDPQTSLDTSRLPKKNGTKLIMRGRGRHFNKILAQLNALQDEETVIVEEITKNEERK